MDPKTTKAFKILLSELEIFLKKIDQLTLSNLKLEINNLKTDCHKLSGAVGFFELSTLENELKGLERQLLNNQADAIIISYLVKIKVEISKVLLQSN